MRRLIRPALRAAARLGLFFAVVAWLVGQRYWVDVYMGRVWLALSPYGCQVFHDGTSSFGYGVRTEPVAGSSIHLLATFAHYFDRLDELHKLDGLTQRTIDNISTHVIESVSDLNRIGMPGLNLLYGKTGQTIAIDHRFILSLMITLNIVLYLVFRSRRGATDAA